MEKNMTKNCEPDGRFVERLGWQLSSECRRLERMKSSGRIALPRRVVATALMAGILMTGVAVIKAADYLKDSWRKKIELARAETEVELKKARLESFQELAARAEKLFASGMMGEEESLMTKFGAEKARWDLERSLLNLDEVKASGVPPRDELHAPIVGGRDFVTERLRNEVGSIEADLEMLTKRCERLKQLVEVGAAPGDELGGIQAEIETRKGAIDGILKRIDLRKRFVAGEIAAREIEVTDRKAVAERNLNEARSRVDLLSKQMERLQRLEALGLVSPTETRQLRYGLDAAQAELKLAALEIEVLNKVK